MKTGNTSFRSLFGEGQRVEIPVIQRDYAQGRGDERSQEIRVRLVKELAKALSDRQLGASPLDLDFVYGRWNSTDRILEPLDGQQRLTTLFLLHWYLASADERFDEFRSWMRGEHGGSCFTYRTRPAAREFFDALVEHAAPIITFTTGAQVVSEWVTNSIWFVRGWLRDPTVRGCLTMLDALHAAFAGSSGLWARLVSTTSPAIVFRLLLLENFGLSDDLYIKMNARGKALTPFEVFKAELEQFVSSSFGDEPCPHASSGSWRDYVSRQFDISWTDLLWRHREKSNEIDSQFIHLIRALVMVACLNQSGEGGLSLKVERLLANAKPSLTIYKELGCLDQGVVKTMVTVLDALAEHESAPRFLGDAGYVNEAAIFRRVLLARAAYQEEGLTFVDWVLFYAWCAFILRFAKDLGEAPVRAAFHDWMRVVTNLARNSGIDQYDRLLAAFKGVRQLSPSSGGDFLSQVAGGALDAAGGFNQQQQREERIKAQLILRSGAWRTLIERAERHPYFYGDIEFILRFSGVLDRVERRGGCAWDDEEDAALRRAFAEWYDRVCAVFREDAAGPGRFPGFLWERALLSEGDYLLPDGRNWSFLDERDRDASWKRLLRGDTRVPDRDARRDVVRRVLARIEPKDVQGSLRTIIAAGVQGDDNMPLPGFRSRLVAEPQLIEYCKRRMVRLEEGTAFLLGRTQRNGYHIDLYVYHLYFRLQARKADLAPFDDPKYVDTAGTYPSSRVDLPATALRLSVTAEKQGPEMQLQLRLPGPNPKLSVELAGWTADSESTFGRKASPESAEAVIVNLAGIVRAHFSAPPTAAPPPRPPGGPEGTVPL